MLGKAEGEWCQRKQGDTTVLRRKDSYAKTTIDVLNNNSNSNSKVF